MAEITVRHHLKRVYKNCIKILREIEKNLKYLKILAVTSKSTVMNHLFCYIAYRPSFCCVIYCSYLVTAIVQSISWFGQRPSKGTTNKYQK